MTDTLNFTNETDLEDYQNKISECFENYERDKFQPLIFCPNCTTTKAKKVTTKRSNTSTAKHITLQCIQCNYIWYLCGSCGYDTQPRFRCRTLFLRDKKKFKLSLVECMKTHERLHHSTSRVGNHTIDFESNETEHDSVYDESNNVASGSPRIQEQESMKYSYSDIQSIFPGNDRLHYIISEKLNSDCYAEHIIRTTWCKNNTQSISQSDILLFLKITRNLILGSRDENSSFVEILSMIEDRRFSDNEGSAGIIRSLSKKNDVLLNYTRKLESILHSVGISATEFRISEQRSEIDRLLSTSEIHNSNDPYVPIALPKTSSDARKIVESNNGFVERLCSPRVNQVSNLGYAYCHPLEAMKISLALGLRVEFSRKILNRSDNEAYAHRSIFRSEMIQKKINKGHFNDEDVSIVFGLWSDGYESGGTTKGSRSSVKLTTLHLCSNRITTKHVFPVAIGRSKSDHEVIRRKLWEDIRSFSNSSVPCIVHGLPGISRVRFILGYTIQDRPEHSEWTGFMSHTGIFSTVPGISCPIRILNRRSSDTSATGIRVDSFLSSCNRCYLKRKQCLSAYRYQRNGFPITSLCDNCNDWNMDRVTFRTGDEFPKDAPGYATIMKSKKITFETMRDAITLIFEKIYKYEWTKQKAKQFAQVECIRHEITNAVYDHASKTRPKKTDLDLSLPLPPLPNSILPAAMAQNLLPLEDCLVGVMHTAILNLGRHFLTTIKEILSQQNLWTSMFPFLNSHQLGFRKLSLSWCKCWNFGTSVDNPMAAWVSENFLGFAVACKGMIPIVSINPGISERIRHLIIDNILCYNSIIAMLMSPEYEDVGKCDYLFEIIKHFLSKFNELDSELIGSHLPKIETASCFLNLLSFPRIMKEKGVLRNYWEGDMKGEGIVRVFKPLIRRGIDLDGTMTKVLNRMYKVQAVDDLIQDHSISLDNYLGDIPSIEESQTIYEKDRFRRFKSYRNTEDFLESIRASKPIAFILDKESRSFHMINGIGRNKKLIRLSINMIMEEHSTSKFLVNISSVHTERDVSNIDLNSILAVIGIPMGFHEVVEDTDNQEIRKVTMYCVRTEEHKELVSVTPLKFESPLFYCHCHNDPLDNDLGGRAGMSTTLTRPIIGPDGSNLSHLRNFKDRHFCKKWIERRCKSIPGTGGGKIVHFKYKKGLIAFEYCRWTVKYYADEDFNGRCISKKSMNYWQMQDSLLPIHGNEENI